MKDINLSVRYTEYSNPEELPAEDRSLLALAKESIDHAYAPYSHYQVGAAVKLENGKTFTGSNQENVAFPSGLCAERVALFYASSQFPDVPVKALAITAHASGFNINEPVTPCGACRQVIAETEHRMNNSIRIILKGETDKVYVIDGITNLLPLMFHANELKK